MSEKRFNIAYGGNVITDKDGRDLDLTVKWCVEELVDLLNEQQATITSLKEENIELKKLRKYCADFIGVKEENLYEVVR